MKIERKIETYMTILILGGTGRTGIWTLREALERGHEVHALVRDLGIR